MEDLIIHDAGGDGIDRRGFLKCMAWAGTAMIFAAEAGILRSSPAHWLEGESGGRTAPSSRGGGFRFAQISDSHIGFDREPNRDVTTTLRAAIARIDALAEPPDFILHTGDLTHLSKPAEFDTVSQVLGESRVKQVFFVPGEHDVLDGTGALFRQRHGEGSRGDGWLSFDHKGVHFVGLVNVMNLKAGGLGNLGAEQLEWLEADLRPLGSSTPVVVFAHVPLWTVYPDWGWGTEDGGRALGYLRRFGSVTVLNGHIHQVVQKIEGHVTFHTAMSTAFPQPRPGTAPSPGPMKVPPDHLGSLLGATSVEFTGRKHPLAIVDATLDPAGRVAPAPALLK